MNQTLIIQFKHPFTPYYLNTIIGTGIHNFKKFYISDQEYSTRIGSSFYRESPKKRLKRREDVALTGVTETGATGASGRTARNQGLPPRIIRTTSESTKSVSPWATNSAIETHLVRHMELHSEQKAYACSKCDKRFAQKRCSHFAYVNLHRH